MYPSAPSAATVGKSIKVSCFSAARTFDSNANSRSQIS
jgi:hypothetical protein